MKKILSKFIVAILMIQWLISNAFTVQALDKEYIIGIDPAFAPYAYINDEGDYEGIIIDIFNAVAEDQGIKYEYHNMQFSAALQALESNQIDGIAAGTTITPERAEVFDFSEPYYVGGNMFAVRADSDIESLDDLQGKKVAVKSGTTGFDVGEDFEEEYGYQLTVYEDSPSMYEAVMVGHEDAAIEVTAVMAYAINTRQVDIKQIGEDIRPAEMGFAVNKGVNQELLQRFDIGLANIKENGIYDEIIDKYVGENAQADTGSFMHQLKTNLPALTSGLWTTLWVALLSILIATIIGILLGLILVINHGILKKIIEFYISLMRGIPMLVFVFFVYFGIAQWFKVSFTPETAGITALSINTSAFIAEIVRGGIEAIPKGQMEAGESTGLSRTQIMRYIILPQALQVMTPAMINQFIVTIKNTSILSVIGMVELTQTGRIIISRTYQSGNIWLIVGIMYYIMITALVYLSNQYKRKYDL